VSTPKTITIDLTPTQQLSLHEHFKHVASEADAGRRGMLVAQIQYEQRGGRAYMHVGFIEEERAKLLETKA
jgi:hypothetical protein